MSDTVLLGAIALGLGMYCLYLHHKIRMLNGAGQFVAEMLVRMAQEHCKISEREAADVVKQFAIKLVAEKIKT